MKRLFIKITDPAASARTRRHPAALWLGGGIALFAAGFLLGPGPLARMASAPAALASAPIRLASVGDVQIGPLIPLPADQHEPTATERQEANTDMPPVETYTKVLQKLQSAFYQKPTSTRELTYSAIRGMLASLGDRYTRFLDPDEFRRMTQDNQGEFGGIGASLEKDHGQTVVKEVVPHSPAEAAGVKAKDAILKVDGKPMLGTSILKVVDAIRGQKGTTVKLTLERKGVAQPIVKSIVRDIITLPNVTSEIILDANKKSTGIAHISLGQFNELADTEVDAAMRKMQRQGMKALIFDLRGNPGGLLTQAVAIGSRFVESGPIVIIERGGQRNPMMSIRSAPKYHGPLVVLVNKLSASASEIVSGAIKDTNSGVLVGVDTWGKGLVQTITPIRDDGSAVLITTHRYLTPAGIDINKKGIAPHVKVVMTRADFDAKRDPQLTKAVSILKGDLASGTATAQRH